MGEGVLPGFRCLGSSLGWDGEGGASGCLRCDVARKVFSDSVFQNGSTLSRDSGAVHFVGCQGCFVDSVLQIWISPNRWVKVFFVGWTATGNEQVLIFFHFFFGLVVSWGCKVDREQRW